MELKGLHHVTAITGNTAENLAFYTQVLGLRLVKKTVNQDDVSAYHLFYADAIGSPGTDVTFFDWPQTPMNRNGAGSIARIGLRVHGPDALDWWANRLDQMGVPNSGLARSGGRMVLRFTDLEGQELELADDHGAPGGEPWPLSPVPAPKFISGLNNVKLMVRELDSLADILTRVLGFQPGREYFEDDDPQRKVTVFDIDGGGPGKEVHVEANADLMVHRLGRGGVHHVAFRTPYDQEQLAWRERIDRSGLHITEVIDRFYFKSIYFRVPGGMLFEIATDGPGFGSDEELEHLGERLALPPFLEPYRDQIESKLHPIELPEA